MTDLAISTNATKPKDHKELNLSLRIAPGLRARGCGSQVRLVSHISFIYSKQKKPSTTVLQQIQFLYHCIYKKTKIFEEVYCLKWISQDYLGSIALQSNFQAVVGTAGSAQD